MALESPREAAGLPAVLRSDSDARPRAWWRRTVPASVAAGVLGATLCATSAAVEVARAWTNTPHAASEASHAVSGMVVALFAIAAFGFATRTRGLAVMGVAAAFALFVQGGALVLELAPIGALYLGLAPMVFLLSQTAFVSVRRAGREPLPNATMLGSWTTTSRRPSALVAPSAVSRTPLAMRGSQATIIDGLETMPNDSSNGPTTLRSCDSSP